MSTSAIHLVLNDDLRRFVGRMVESGRYESAEDLVSAALDLMQRHEAAVDDVRAKIEQGHRDIEEGRVFDGEAVFDELLDDLEVRRKKSA